MGVLWTNLDVLKQRLGITVTTSDLALTQALVGVQSTIQNAIRSPVKLKYMEEWRAPVDDFRLILRWRPVNVLSVTDGTVNPTCVVTNWPAYSVTNGTTLTYDTDFTVYNLDSGDPRFAVAGMLEAVSGGGNGSWWFGGGSFSGQWSTPPTRLAPTRGEARGRLWVTYWAGWPADAIPAAITEAAYLEAATRWQMRKWGQLLASESLDEYSYSLGSPGVVGARQGATGEFVSVAAASLLSQYITPAIAGPGIW